MSSIALCSISQKNFQQQTERGKLKLGIFQFWCGKNHWRTWTEWEEGEDVCVKEEDFPFLKMNM